MAILYCVVSRKTTVLAKYASCVGNFSEISDLVITKIPPEDGKMTYSHGNYLYHYINNNNIIVLAITDDDFERSQAFQFLESVYQKFSRQFGTRAQTAIPYAMNTEFSLVICSEMKRFNTTEQQDPDRIASLREEVDQVKDIMVANIDSIVERGEKLDLLVDKTENLSSNAVTFKTTSTRLARAMWWKNIKMTVAVVVVVIVVIYFIVSMSCGGLDWKNCV
jgi:vesicle-associated membrane protein 7